METALVRVEDASDQEITEWLEWYIDTLVDRRAAGRTDGTEEAVIRSEVGPYGMRPTRSTIQRWIARPEQKAALAPYLKALTEYIRVYVKASKLRGLQNIAEIAATGKGLAAVSAERLLCDLDTEFTGENQANPQGRTRASEIIARFSVRVSAAQRSADFYINLAAEVASADALEPAATMPLELVANTKSDPL